MITNAGVLAALISHEKLAFPDWEIFGDPEVILVEKGPLGDPLRMVRVMLISPNNESEDDQEFFLLTTSADQLQVWSVPPGPWGIRNGMPMIPHVSHLVGYCYELHELTSIVQKEKKP